MDWILDGALGWLIDRVSGALSWLMSVLTSTLFASPDLTVFPQVQALAQRSTTVVDAVFVVVVMVAGAIGMTHGGVQIRYQLKDLMPRLVFAFIASHAATGVCQLLIESANALTAAMIGQSASGPRVVRFVLLRLARAQWDPTSRVLLAVIALVMVVLFFQLLGSWFARIASLLVLAGTAPIALACYALPQTQPVVDLWWRSLFGALAVPLLQGVVFSSGVDLLLDPDHNLLITAGLPPGSDVLNLFLIVCLLLVTVRIPRFVAAHIARGGRSTSTTGVVLRAIVIQSLTRRLPIPGVRRLGRLGR